MQSSKASYFSYTDKMPSNNHIVCHKDRAQIGKYATENGNAAAVCKYDTGESTAHMFKTKYLAALRAQMNNGDSKPVTTIAPG